MSVGNKQLTHLRALDLNKKTVTGTYAVRTGRVTDSFIVDNPVELDPASAFTLTVSDGYKMGQTLLISFQGGDTTAVTVTVTNHTNGTTRAARSTAMNADDEYILFIWLGATWATVNYGGCSDVS